MPSNPLQENDLEADAELDAQQGTPTAPTRPPTILEYIAEAERLAKKNKYRKPKPWDTDDIDKWKVDKFTPEDNPLPFTEESSFATLFPKYRENYLKEVWPIVTRELDKVGIACVLDLIEGSMTVKTTRKTWDPFMIIRARDMIKLLARSVPYQQALKILQDDIACEVVKIGNITRNKERFVKRRQRLIGPNGNTLKAIELTTGCYVLVQGNTVATMGPHQGIKQARRIILDCMKNIHPIYHIKELMIKRELAQDPTLKNESWDRFLPKFKKLSTAKPKLKTSKKAGKKKEYTPFPNPQLPRKVDLQIESGEYFLSQEEKDRRQMDAKQEKQLEKVEERKKQRELAYVAPKEEVRVGMKRQAESGDSRSVQELKDSILSKTKLKKHKKEEADDKSVNKSSTKKKTKK